MSTRILLPSVILVALLLGCPWESWAERAGKDTSLRGDAAKGRDLFNGKGICHYCHGIDGFMDKRPQLTPDTKGVIERLSPPPANLRQPDRLRLKDDPARFHAIRDGHPGTGMVPDTTLSDQDIKDLLAYLATLRKNAPVPGQSAY